jgi:hypothetical protein
MPRQTESTGMSPVFKNGITCFLKKKREATEATETKLPLIRLYLLLLLLLLF